MQNQSPVSIAAPRPAEYLKRHSDLFVSDGPRIPTPDQTAARKRPRLKIWAFNRDGIRSK